jgi:hypothetical protein
MAANKNITPTPETIQADTPQSSSVAGFYSSANTKNLVAPPADTGAFRRRMLTWRTPHLGYVKMYVNPDLMKISDKKNINSMRTKGGYVIQYAGEALTLINISGSTGSSGIEGINVLHAIYRSEQDAFTGIAQDLETKADQLKLDSLTQNNLLSGEFSTGFVENAVKEAIFNNFDQPIPTLASLAASVELFFQGVLYRGYFTEFSVDEKSASPGLFDYSISFTAFAKQGVRRNFMPWHRQPYNPAGGIMKGGATDTNPLSFLGTSEPVNVLVETPPTPPPGRTIPDFTLANEALKASSRNTIKDSFFSPTDQDGVSMAGKDFLTNPPRN